MKGKLGLAVGLAAGYVLGTKAGRERYQQLVASAKRLTDNPSWQRLTDEVNGLFGASKERVGTAATTTVERVGDKAAEPKPTPPPAAPGSTTGTATT